MIGSLWIMSAAYLKIGAIGTGGDLGIGAALQAVADRVCPRVRHDDPVQASR